MGCDIHAYIEMYSKRDSLSSTGCWVHCFAENVGIGRDYRLFGLLANVRSPSPFNLSAKGIPNTPQLSFTCASNYYLTVCDGERTKGVCYDFGRCVSREEAERLIQNKQSFYIDDKKTCIQNPDWHSATYLSLSEMMQVRKNYLIDAIEYESQLSGKVRRDMIRFIEDRSPETLMQFSFPESDSLSLYASIKTMQALELGSEGGDIVSRFVCWFDS